MTKKLLELAQDLNVSSTVLLGKAKALGINAKTNMSILSGSDVEKLTEAVRNDTEGKGVKRGAAAGVPVGRPVVNEALLAGRRRSPVSKPPAGKPVVDEALLAGRKDSAGAPSEMKDRTSAPDEKPPAGKSEKRPAEKTEEPAAPAEANKAGTTAELSGKTSSETAKAAEEVKPAQEVSQKGRKKEAAGNVPEVREETADVPVKGEGKAAKRKSAPAEKKTGTEKPAAKPDKPDEGKEKTELPGEPESSDGKKSENAGTVPRSSAGRRKSGAGVTEKGAESAPSAKRKTVANSTETSSASETVKQAGADRTETSSDSVKKDRGDASKTGVASRGQVQGKKKAKGGSKENTDAASSREKAKTGQTKKNGEEPKIHLAASETINTPKIKIIKRGGQEKPDEQTQAQKSRRNGKAEETGRKPRKAQSDRRNAGEEGSSQEKSGRTARGGRDRQRQAAGEAGERRRPQRITSQGAISQEHSGRNRRKNRREDAHSKFDIFEQKSLEKRDRKKYTKNRPEADRETEEEILPEGTFRINVPITIAGFCEQTEMSNSQVIMALMKMGIMANINQTIDEETVTVLADELGISVVVGAVEEDAPEEGIEDFEDKERDLRPRPPVVTVMGHVDHGKTSLLDAIRSTNVTASESGGITQHIGASEVEIKGRKIVFLDTPGHEAFTAMRARGAHITDIAVLVVAADDGVMPQTVESISHAKAADVPIIVAINKMDKPGANPERVKKELADHGVLVEDWGGDVISVEVSAKKKEGIEDLLEMILLQADILELKANPNRLAMGSVIEAKLDKARGPVATLLVTNGTLRSGQSLVAGTCSGRIRLMTDDKNRKIYKAGPATAVEILGLTDVPQAGDNFNVVRDDKTAREIAGKRQEKLREDMMARDSSMSLEKLFSQIKQGEVKELNLIIKADVQGSVGALVTSLEKLNTDDVKVNIIHSGVGTVNESDVMLAGTSDAVIIGFNVRPGSAVVSQAEQAGVEIRLYRVIYDAINDVEAAMKGMLEPEYKEEVLGRAVIRDTFKVPGVGIVGGAYITDGKVLRNADIRLVRDGIVIHEGTVSSLKRFRDDVREVAQGYECGIGIEDYNDIKIDDVIECFHMVEVKPL